MLTDFLGSPRFACKSLISQKVSWLCRDSNEYAYVKCIMVLAVNTTFLLPVGKVQG